MGQPPSDFAARSVAALTLGAAALLAVVHCPSFAPGPLLTPASTPALLTAATGAGPTASTETEPGTVPGEMPLTGPDDEDRPRAGFAFSKSGRLLSTWTDCACPSGDRSLPQSCRVAIWDLPKRRVMTSFAAACVPSEHNVLLSPSDDRVYLSSLGLLRAHSAADGVMAYELGDMECSGHAELSTDGQKLFRMTSCGALELYRAGDGERLGAAEVRTYDENAVVGPEITWDERNDVIGVSLDGRAVTLAPLHGGRPLQVLLPGAADRQVVALPWLRGSSRLLVHRSDGLLALLETTSGRLQTLSGPSPSPQKSSAWDLSAAGDRFVRIAPSRRVQLWDLLTGTSQDLGLASDTTDPNAEIAVYTAPDARSVATVQHTRRSASEGTCSVRLWTIPESPAVSRREDGPNRPVDVVLKEGAGAAIPVGWAADSSFIVHNDGTLLSIGQNGATRVVRRLEKAPHEVRLTPNRRAVLVRGKDLLWVSLTDGRTATLVLSGAGDGLEGHIEGVDSDADWAAMGG